MRIMSDQTCSANDPPLIKKVMGENTPIQLSFYWQLPTTFLQDQFRECDLLLVRQTYSYTYSNLDF